MKNKISRLLMRVHKIAIVNLKILSNTHYFSVQLTLQDVKNKDLKWVNLSQILFSGWEFQHVYEDKRGNVSHVDLELRLDITPQDFIDILMLNGSDRVIAFTVMEQNVGT